MSRSIHNPLEGMMSITHLHLLLNHFPVIGTLMVIVLFALAIVRKSSELTKTSLALLVGLAVLAVVVYLTGEPAEKAIEKLPDYSHALTERHEEFALAATIALGSVGVLAAGLLVGLRNRPMPRWVMVSGLVMSLVAGGMMGYTAMLGGQVRHTELRPGATNLSTVPDNHD
jgi:uncharacterized membrane protein